MNTVQKTLSVFILGAFFFIPNNRIQAQGEKLLTPEACVSRSMRPQSLLFTAWRGKTEFFTFTDFQKGALMQQGVKKGSEPEVLVSVKDINGKLPDRTPELRYFPPADWQSDNEFLFMHAGSLWSYDLIKKILKKEAHSNGQAASAQDYSSTRNLAYVKDHNLMVCEKGETAALQVTTDGSKDIVYGQAVHRHEFGIGKGTFWSPKGRKLAFYRMDQAMVNNYPLVDYSTFPAEEKIIKYPMAGTPSHHVKVGIYDTKSRKTVYISTEGDPEQYYTNIAWSPDEKDLFIAVVNRDQNEMKLNRYNAETGDFVGTLFTETDKEYVEPEHPMIFRKGSSSEFLWFSERDGYNHLYLYDLNDKTPLKPKKQLTKGDWIVTEFLNFSEDGKSFYFMSTAESPLERHLYQANLENEKLTQLTFEKGTHSTLMHPSGEYVLDTYDSRSVPNVTQVLKAGKNKVLNKAQNASNPLEAYNLGEMEFVTLKAGDDKTTLHGRLFKPADFDASKKYPVMVYVYGGPHAQLITESWNGGAQLFLQYMAQQGFVVFTVDNRGSAGRGLEFEQAIFRNLGVKETEDQLKGIEYLKSLPYVDSDRIGVFGWSFGGFMATNLMLRHADIFKVGVAGGPVIDWNYYEIMYGERYMDHPEKNKEGYKNTDLSNIVTQLKGRLMVIHGLQDDVVVPQHSRDFIRSCVKNNVQVDYFPYPSHPHNVRGPERAHLLRKVAQYFKDHL